MTNMWEALERYQPYADRHGFGAEWRRMTTERTPEAAWAAARAAAAAAAAEWEARAAIQNINEALKLEETK